MSNPLSSPNDYTIFIHDLPNRYSSIQGSSLVYISLGVKVGKVIGMVFFADDTILCVQEFLNFELHVIEGYGYELSRSQAKADELPKPQNTVGLHILLRTNCIGMTLFPIRMTRL